MRERWERFGRTALKRKTSGRHARQRIPNSRNFPPREAIGPLTFARRVPKSIPLYKQFVACLIADFGKPVHTGQFAADMKISLTNDCQSQPSSTRKFGNSS